MLMHSQEVAFKKGQEGRGVGRTGRVYKIVL